MLNVPDCTSTFPPITLSGPLVEEADAIESVPPEIVSGWVEVRLLMESVTASECSTFAAMSIVTSSPEPGSAFVLQFAGLSQLLSPPSPVQRTPKAVPLIPSAPTEVHGSRMSSFPISSHTEAGTHSHRLHHRSKPGSRSRSDWADLNLAEQLETKGNKNVRRVELVGPVRDEFRTDADAIRRDPEPHGQAHRPLCRWVRSCLRYTIIPASTVIRGTLE